MHEGNRETSGVVVIARALSRLPPRGYDEGYESSEALPAENNQFDIHAPGAVLD